MSANARTASGPLQVKATIDGFANSVKAFRSDLDRRMTAYEAKLDRLQLDLRRPRRGAGEAPDPGHGHAFSRYLRKGDELGLRELDLKALSTTVDADGGYLVSPQTSDEIVRTLKSTSPMRAVANVVTSNAGALEILIDQDEAEAVWADETSARAETDTPTIDRITIPLHEITASPKASQRLLDDSAVDVEAWLAAQVADKFRRAENAAFVAGDAVDKPRGLLDYPTVAQASWSWGDLGYVATGVDGAFAASDPGDAIIDLVYALDAGYRQGAVFMMNSTTAGQVRKFKDADGRYLWAEAVGADGRPSLLGHPVMIAEDMPDVASGSFSIAFGDFRAGYTIVDRAGVRTLRDPYSAKPHVLFYTTKRVGGAVTDFNAIKLMKFDVS